MKMKGVPVLSEWCSVSAILLPCTSPAEPPATVKSWLATVHRPSVDFAAAGDHAIGRQRLVRHAEKRRPMLRKQPRFPHRIAIQQRRQPLPRRQFAFAVLFGGAIGAAAGANAFLSFMERRDAILRGLGRMRHHIQV